MAAVPDAVKAPAAPTGPPINITVDPPAQGLTGLPVDSATLQDEAKKWNNYTGNMSLAFNRETNASYINIPGFNFPMTGSYPATVSVTPDGQGLSISIQAGDAADNSQNLFWAATAVQFLGQMVASYIQASCVWYYLGAINSPNAPTPLQRLIVANTCNTVGNLLTGLVASSLVLAVNNALPDPSPWPAILGQAVGGAVAATIWQLGFVQKFANWFNFAASYLAIKKFDYATDNILNAMVVSARQFNTLSEDWTADENAIVGKQTAPTASSDPCDIDTYYGTPCDGAFSSTRALYAAYDGPLYEVQRNSDGKTEDIYPVAPGGVADSATQDSFCSLVTCKITILYDQSPDWNDLTVAPGGGAAPNPDQPVYADALPVSLGGSHRVYGMDFTGAMGYRNNSPVGVATDDPSTGTYMGEGMYMVASGTNVNSGCCFDFGNAETNSLDNGDGHMDAVNLSTTCYWASSQGSCTGSGPWVEADLENGLFQGGNGTNKANTGNGTAFVTAMLKNNGTDTYALKGADATTGGLTTYWNGALPSVPGQAPWAPMSKEGAIILGTGGDNSNWGIGSFFEGAMTIGYPSDTADSLIQQNVAKAGYSGNSVGSGGPQADQAGAAVVHDGYTSDFTVDSANGHLEESYLPKMNGPWYSHDLSLTTMADTPPVMAGTKPVAVYHQGYTSVFTVDADNGDLQETYLAALGGGWATRDLSALFHTPATNVTPTAVLHDGYLSVYSIDASDGHLWESYQPAIGVDWKAQDLSATTMADTPPVAPGTSPVSVVHDGYTSVYTIDASQHLEETYLPLLGGPWHSQDLAAQTGKLPNTTVTPAVVVHDGYVSVYTTAYGTDHLWETYLPALGKLWISQDLTAMTSKNGAPGVAVGTSPVAVYHTGYTSVYTVAFGTDHLWETYLPAIGDSWTAQDLQAQAHMPATAQTPDAVVHPDPNGAMTFTSVFTTDQFTDHLWETWLPAIGDQWTSHDLSLATLAGTPPVAGNEVAPAGPSVVHDGYTSVFTVNADNGHLQEAYLPAMNSAWAVHDLSVMAKTPTVHPGTKPIALYHQGYTSVFTVDEHGDLWETYLMALGGAWASHDLSASTMANTPTTQVSPSVVFHQGWVSVYTVDSGSGDLEETYLPQLGGAWTAQDLTVKYSSPKVQAGTSPAAVLHSGWVSVYTVDPAHHLWESYLPAIGDRWTAQDLTVGATTPTTTVTPAVVVHQGWVSVYSVDENTHHLDETYLAGMGDKWSTQDVSALSKGPGVAPGTSPVALYHNSFTSVYTAAWGNNHLYETYLSTIGAGWTALDLTATANTPSTTETPIALLHPDTSGALTWTSVFTVAQTGQGTQQDLDETYLPAIGQNWVTQDLSSNPAYKVPKVAINTAPTSGAALAHDGYTSVFSVGLYGQLQESYLSAMGKTWVTQNLDSGATLLGAGVSSLEHDGITSVYWVNHSGSNAFVPGDLMETYLTVIGGAWATQDLTTLTGAPQVALGVRPSAVYHDGFTSVFTVDASTGDLRETYLSAFGQHWATHDLTTNGGAPAVSAGTSPVAVYHSGWVSVFTINTRDVLASTYHDLWETYLPAIGDQWASHSLTALAKIPDGDARTPAAVVHDGYVSVFTTNYGTHFLEENYLPAIGGQWVTQNLNTILDDPGVAPGTAPVAIYHNGYTSVYSVDWAGTTANDLRETYLPAIGQQWHTQNLSSVGTPKSYCTPAPVLHYDGNGNLTFTSVYTCDSSGNYHLDETYLPVLGQQWAWQDLSAVPNSDLLVEGL